MILCADIGNAAIKFAAVDNDHVVAVERFRTADAGDRDAIDALLGRISGSVGGLERSIVCSVVPQAMAHVADALERITGNTPHRFTHLSRLPFAIDVPEPESVGPDRLAAAAGAVAKGLDSVIVIDAGTAITVDAVHQRRFLGGVIMPGPALALRALHQYASLLPDIVYDEVDPDPGLDGRTAHSMVLGATHGAVGGIFQAVSVIESWIGDGIPKVVTGGHAAAISHHLPATWAVDLHLTLVGLSRVPL